MAFELTKEETSVINVIKHKQRSVERAAKTALEELLLCVREEQDKLSEEETKFYEQLAMTYNIDLNRFGVNLNRTEGSFLLTCELVEISPNENNPSDL